MIQMIYWESGHTYVCAKSIIKIRMLSLMLGTFFFKGSSYSSEILEFVNFHGKLVSFRPFTHVIHTGYYKQYLGGTDGRTPVNIILRERKKIWGKSIYILNYIILVTHWAGFRFCEDDWT